MNYMFSDKWDIRYYLDKEVGTKVTDEIFDIIDKDEIKSHSDKIIYNNDGLATAKEWIK